jgi:hypothetical protein
MGYAEYRKAAEELGDVIATEPVPWASGFYRKWYWDFLANLTLDLPLVSYDFFAAIRYNDNTPRPSMHWSCLMVFHLLLCCQSRYCNKPPIRFPKASASME